MHFIAWDNLGITALNLEGKRKEMWGNREVWWGSPEKRKTAVLSGFSKDLSGGQGRDRTGDTRIFSPLLYQLSYLATIVQGLNGRSAGIRTLDPVIKSHLLYQLSYAPIHLGFWSEERDSNPRQPPWQGGTLPTELSSHRENGV